MCSWTCCVGLGIYNTIDKMKNSSKCSGWLNFRRLFDPIISIGGIVGAVVAIDSIRRIVSQDKDLY